MGEGKRDSPGSSPSPQPGRHGGAAGAESSLATALLWAAAAAAAGLYAVRNFHAAFPISEIDITMGRDAALAAGAALASDLALRPAAVATAGSGAPWHAASFDVDNNVQVFVELERGLPTWREMLGAPELVHYSPYFWAVRRYREGEIAEAEVRFNPLGEPIGFSQSLPEDEAGAALPASDARALVVAALDSVEGCARWRVDLGRYREIEHSEKDRAGGRRDHTFT